MVIHLFQYTIFLWRTPYEQELLLLLLGVLSLSFLLMLFFGHKKIHLIYIVASFIIHPILLYAITRSALISHTTFVEAVFLLLLLQMILLEKVLNPAKNNTFLSFLPEKLQNTSYTYYLIYPILLGIVIVLRDLSGYFTLLLIFFCHSHYYLSKTLMRVFIIYLVFIALWIYGINTGLTP